jgi:hypothetical protein
LPFRIQLKTDEWDDALSPATTETVAINATPVTSSNGAGGGSTSATDAPEPEPHGGNVGYRMVRPDDPRPRIKGWRWCPQWWQHAEAVARLEALWRSWESMRLDGTTGMSVWWRDHCDPHLAAQDRSPFKQCSEDKGHVGEDEPLSVEPTPPGWWGNDTKTVVLAAGDS